MPGRLVRPLRPWPDLGESTVWAGESEVRNTAAETTFSPTYVVQSNMLKVGDVVSVSFAGVYAAAALQTLTIKLKWGSTTVFTSGAVSSLPLVDTPWMGLVQMYVRAKGASGEVDPFGKIELATVVLGEAVSTTVDTLNNPVLSMTAQWGAANAANTVKLRKFLVS